MRAAALVLACALVACDDGEIRLSSGATTPDATAPGADAAPPLDGSSGGSVDGASGGDAAAPPDAATAADAGSACASDTQCLLTTLHCDVTSGTCVECTSDVQCTRPGYPRCDLASHRCVACGVNADCADGGVCEPTTLRCVTPCNDAGHCPNDDDSCDSRGYCVACGGAQDGGGCTGAQVCDDDNGQCGECIKDSQCPSSKPHCDLGTDRCVQCLSSSQCPAATPACDPSTWTCVVP